MISSLLKLKNIILKIDQLDVRDDWICLTEQDPRTYLILNEDLARELLKHQAISPENLLRIWKIINRLDQSDLPYLTEYFDHTPMFHDAEEHEIRRNSLKNIYQNIENSLDVWLSHFNQSYLARYQEKAQINIINFAVDYIEQVNKQILAKELNITPDSVPGFQPTRLFLFTPSAKNLQAFENKTGHVVNFLKKELTHLNRPISEIWALVTLNIMGQEPLLGALMYGLINKSTQGNNWTGELLCDESNPVSAISRIATQDITLGSLTLEKGDVIVINPQACHKHSDLNNSKNHRSMAFGHGPHVCTGRKIVTKIIDQFFKDFEVHPIEFEPTKIKFKRDINIIPMIDQS